MVIVETASGATRETEPKSKAVDDGWGCSCACEEKMEVMAFTREVS